MYIVKENGGKTDIKSRPLLYGLRNLYRNLKSENSQDYAQKPQRNFTFMNSASDHIILSAPAVNLKPALRKDNEEGMTKTQDQ